MTADSASVTVSPRMLPCMRMFAACRRAASSMTSLRPVSRANHSRKSSSGRFSITTFGTHRLHPGPVAARGSHGSTRHLAAAVDEHLGAGMHGRIAGSARHSTRPSRTRRRVFPSTIAIANCVPSWRKSPASSLRGTRRWPAIRRNIDVKFAPPATMYLRLPRRWRWRAPGEGFHRPSSVTSESPRTSSAWPTRRFEPAASTTSSLKGRYSIMPGATKLATSPRIAPLVGCEFITR